MKTVLSPPANYEPLSTHTPRESEKDYNERRWVEREQASRYYDANKDSIELELKIKRDANRQAEAEKNGFASYAEMWEHPFWKDSDKI